jgi:hypothetical protein
MKFPYHCRGYFLRVLVGLSKDKVGVDMSGPQLLLSL